MIRTNYHTHSLFCDGSMPMEDYVIAAIDNGFSSLGFTSHSPITDDNGFSIAYANIPDYIQTIAHLKQKYHEHIEILSSFEFDYIPGLTRPMKEVAQELNFDYILGSVHLVVGREPIQSEKDLWFTDGGDIAQYDKGLTNFFQMNIQKAVGAFYHQTCMMLENETLDIIGHFDKIKMNNKGRYFQEDEPWYIRKVNEVIDLIAEKNVIVEVNTRGIYKQRHPDYFPSLTILKELKKRQIPITVCSDAHAPKDIACLWDQAYQCCIDLGFRPEGRLRNIEILR